MIVGDVVDLIQSQMADSGVYRPDSFVLELFNDGAKLLALFTLYNEQSTSARIDGSRNYAAMPKVGNKNCLAALYVSDMSTGYRINPAQIEDFEFYTSRWEGVIEGNPQYYTTTGRWSPAHCGLVFCPISSYGDTNFYFVGAYEPEDYIDDDGVDLDDNQLEAVIRYVKFMCYISEPARGEDALEEYKQFLSLLEQLQKAHIDRFPGGRDVEPVPVELKQLGVTRYEPKKSAKEDEE